VAVKVLVVDDEKGIVKGIKHSLVQDGMQVSVAYDGDEAVKLFREESFDLIILDVMLPKLDGLQVCQIIREESSIPVIMVTAKGDDMDKIIGLDYGADDYLTKPFNMLELKARMKAILRRMGKGPRHEEETGDHKRVRELVITPSSRRVTMRGKDINLTTKEFRLLEYLMDNAGTIYSRENLLGIIWGQNFPGDVRTVDVHVRRLREKIEENPSEPKYLHTRWGEGYFFE
jgi:DNA-binding response OmpR family regulator